MPVSVATRSITLEEFDTLPDDGVERWIIRGQLREKPMSTRSLLHAHAVAMISCHLVNWNATQQRPRGKVLSGDAGVIFNRDSEVTILGVDISYINAELASRKLDRKSRIEGVPTLAVEIRSPSNDDDEIAEKISQYIECGVPLVWIVDPWFQTVTVHRPNHQPEMFNNTEEITGESHLPGFRLPVIQMFDDPRA